MNVIDRKPLTFGSLFAGVGGLDLGLERAGMECRWQVEIDDYATRVLERHWPRVRRWRDARTWPQPDTEHVDLICGGPPCQPVSFAGKRLGDSDKRWLWDDTLRIILALRPRYAVLENPPALLSIHRGRLFGRILGRLAECGYDAEWQLLPAGAFGAAHFRERVFMVAYSHCERRKRILGDFKEVCIAPVWKDGGIVRSRAALESYRGVIERLGYDLCRSKAIRTADAVSSRVDRLRCLGNAVVPQVAEYIGHQIVEFDSLQELRK